SSTNSATNNFYARPRMANREKWWKRSEDDGYKEGYAKNARMVLYDSGIALWDAVDFAAFYTFFFIYYRLA
ncbi:hypothetical protein ACJX0J_023793, partial [Zea mays]